MRENVTVEIGESPTNVSQTKWQEFWSWKTRYQLCAICVVPFVLIFIGCVLLGLHWSGSFSKGSSQAVLTCGMVSFFSGFLVCVIANFCDACGVTCSKHEEVNSNDAQNNTMFLDLSELGPRPNDPEFDDDKSENSPQTEVDLFENHSEPQRK